MTKCEDDSNVRWNLFESTRKDIHLLIGKSKMSKPPKLDQSIISQKNMRKRSEKFY